MNADRESRAIRRVMQRGYALATGAWLEPQPSAPGITPAPLITLSWLLQLRWGAVAGQLLTVAVASLGLGVRLPIASLVGVIALTAVTNLALWRRLEMPRPPSPRVVGAILVADTLLLTALLQLSGGPANPFGALYLLHVTLAVVLLGSRWGWGIVALSAASYGLLFFWHVPLLGLDVLVSPEWSLHLRGIWFAFVVASAVIVYFVGRISAELRERERELAGVQALFARNDKLDSLSTLAAGAAHELGTPLGTIAIVARELERTLQKMEGQGTLAEDARLIRQQVERCRGILVQMSAKAGENAGEVPGPVHVNTVVDGVKAALSPEQAARLSVTVAASMTSVIAPRQALVLVLASLVRNAFDASPEGAPVAFSIVREDGFACFSVDDAGHGMSPEVLSRAGDPFFTTKEPGKGTGLGLFLARTFAERLGGRLSLESNPGAGTCATIELPLEASAAASSAMAPA